MRWYLLFFVLFRTEVFGQKYHALKPAPGTTGLRLAPGLTYEILYSEGDSVLLPSGASQPARGSHDFNAFIPLSDTTALLYTSHETHKPHKTLGDGGGAGLSPLVLKAGRWHKSGQTRHVDFSTVYGTIRNCGGSLTPRQTILTAEEAAPENNSELLINEGITDTTAINGIDRYLNYGWMVEVDPASGKAMHKCIQMGRFSHEDVHIMPDRQTIYLTADETPAVLFKFISKVPDDFREGQLYAYQQSEDGESGSWISLPMHFDSLCRIIPVAASLGATLFVRHEWIDGYQDKIYITETGSDRFDLSKDIKAGGKAALHLSKLYHPKEGVFKDPYGRILELDLKSGKIRPLLEGGLYSEDSLCAFSNPDGLLLFFQNGNPMLAISEDNNGIEYGKVAPENYKKKEQHNEFFFLDLKKTNPKPSDLERIVSGPRGCETTGAVFSSDGKTLFLSIQSPDPGNPPPFNRSCVIGISGF
jgi:secreted PhoX family phosphatase